MLGVNIKGTKDASIKVINDANIKVKNEANIKVTKEGIKETNYAKHKVKKTPT
jgi:hypothetical protein